MYFRAKIAVILWLSLFAEVHPVFYFKISEGWQLDRDNIQRSRHSYVPWLEPGLFTCRNEELEDGWTLTSCISVGSWFKYHVYTTANFFNVYQPEQKLGHIIKLNKIEIQIPPAVMGVGFNPLDVDSPKFDPFPASRAKIYDGVDELTYGKFIDDDDVEDMVDYLCCNDISTCFLADIERAHDVFLPVMRKALMNIISAHYMFVFLKETKQAVEDDPFKGPTIWTMQRAMKMMVDKLIDPCMIFLLHGESKVDETCDVYCRFLSATVEAFAKTIKNSASSCKSLRDGYCFNSMCFCNQILDPRPFSCSAKLCPPKMKTVKMFVCNNELRNNLAGFQGPIWYDFAKKPLKEDTPQSSPHSAPGSALLLLPGQVPSPKFTPKNHQASRQSLQSPISAQKTPSPSRFSTPLLKIFSDSYDGTSQKSLVNQKTPTVQKTISSHRGSQIFTRKPPSSSG